MSTPTFGMTFTRPNDEPLPVLGADFSKILLIETSNDASASEYPEDTPVRISTSNGDTVEALGTGYRTADYHRAAVTLRHILRRRLIN
ncbi:hypothetical protein ABE530_15235 [Brucella sp. TWI559]